MDDDDSFVVGNSVVEYVSSLDELDMVDEFESDAEPSKKTRYSDHSVTGHVRYSNGQK